MPTYLLKKEEQMPEVDVDQVRKIIGIGALERLERLSPVQRRLEMVAAVAITICTKPGDDARLRAVATQVFLEDDFDDVERDEFFEASFRDAFCPSRLTLQQKFRDVYPVQFKLAHDLLSYGLADKEETASQQNTRYLALVSGDDWREHLSPPVNPSLTHDQLLRNIAAIYHYESWCEGVMSAYYLAGVDTERSVRAFQVQFCHVPHETMHNQSSMLVWLAYYALQQSWLLEDYPDELAFYAEFRRRMGCD